MAAMKLIAGACAVASLCACTTTPPNAPSIMALPGTGKSFDQFRADSTVCRQFAQEQVSGQTADGTGADSGVRSAALGTLLGAAAGAAINGGRGASVGAGAGLAMGGLAGTGAAEVSSSRLQQRYDNGYVQCMYAQGHRVPVSGTLTDNFFRGRTGRGDSSTSSYFSPPPPGAPPPPR
jgi:uncharacterized protein YcfJ